MDIIKTACKCLIWIIFILCFIDSTLARGGARFGRYSSYRSYRSYTYYYYYYYGSYYITTGAIVGIVFGSLVGAGVLIVGCILCCVCCCAASSGGSRGEVVQTNPSSISTITSSQMTTHNVNSEPSALYTSPQYTNQYNTEYSAPPPSYNEVTSTGNVNLGFK